MKLTEFKSGAPALVYWVFTPLLIIPVVSAIVAGREAFLNVWGTIVVVLVIALVINAFCLWLLLHRSVIAAIGIDVSTGQGWIERRAAPTWRIATHDIASVHLAEYTRHSGTTGTSSSTYRTWLLLAVEPAEWMDLSRSPVTEDLDRFPDLPERARALTIDMGSSGGAWSKKRRVKKALAPTGITVHTHSRNA